MLLVFQTWSICKVKIRPSWANLTSRGTEKENSSGMEARKWNFPVSGRFWVRVFGPGALLKSWCGQTQLGHVGTLSQTPIIDSLHHFIIKSQIKIFPQQERRISLGGFIFYAENVNMLFHYTKSQGRTPKFLILKGFFSLFEDTTPASALTLSVLLAPKWKTCSTQNLRRTPNLPTFPNSRGMTWKCPISLCLWGGSAAPEPWGKSGFSITAQPLHLPRPAASSPSKQGHFGAHQQLHILFLSSAPTTSALEKSLFLKKLFLFFPRAADAPLETEDFEQLCSFQRQL